MKSTFVHSCEHENDKIQCKVKNIYVLTQFVNENTDEIAAIKPVQFDFLHKVIVLTLSLNIKFLEKLGTKNSYLKYPRKDADLELKVNVKLKTRQFLYGGENIAKICNECGVYLKEALISNNSKEIIVP
jgi:hypothetical protein